MLERNGLEIQTGYEISLSRATKPGTVKAEGKSFSIEGESAKTTAVNSGADRSAPEGRYHNTAVLRLLAECDCFGGSLCSAARNEARKIDADHDFDVAGLLGKRGERASWPAPDFLFRFFTGTVYLYEM